MTTLRDSILHRFDRAGWRHIGSVTEDLNGVTTHTDVLWFPFVPATGDVVEPVVVVWDRGTDWEPREHLSGGHWIRHSNHGDVLTSLGHVADRDA